MNHAIHTGRFLVIALIVPLVITLVAIIVTFSIASTLPSSVAVHWGPSGMPDGFGSPFTFPILITVLSLPLDVIFGGIALVSAHRAPATVMIKILSIVGVFISVLLAVALGGEILLEQGGAVLQHVSLLPLPIGFGAAILFSVGAWFLLPRAVKTSRADGTPVAPVALGVQERASWIRSATAPAWLTWSVVGFMIAISALVLVSILVRGSGLWPVTFVPVLLFLIVLSNFAWTVRVDERGLRLRSSLGIPNITVKLSDIESADVIDVQAIAQYGGYGVRWGLNGRFGVILRSGDALEVHRRAGRTVVVTVDDPSGAAALINALVQRASTPVVRP